MVSVKHENIGQISTLVKEVEMFSKGDPHKQARKAKGHDKEHIKSN